MFSVFKTSNKVIVFTALPSEMLFAGNLMPLVDAEYQTLGFLPRIPKICCPNTLLLLFSAGVHTLKFADCHVDWYSLDEVYLYVESATFFIRQKLGMQKGEELFSFAFFFLRFSFGAKADVTSFALLSCSPRFMLPIDSTFVLLIGCRSFVQSKTISISLHSNIMSI